MRRLYLKTAVLLVTLVLKGEGSENDDKIGVSHPKIWDIKENLQD